MKYQVKEMNSLRKARETSVFIYKFLELDPSNEELNLVACQGYCSYRKPHFSKREQLILSFVPSLLFPFYLKLCLPFCENMSI